jgi:hypothetical protein
MSLNETNFIIPGIGDLVNIFEQYPTPIKPLGLLAPTNLVLQVSSISTDYVWASIANSTGQYIYVWAESINYTFSKSTLYFSSNFGQTFNPVSLAGQTQGAFNFLMVAVSNSGQYVAISAVNSGTIASIFISSNYGTNFNNVTYPPGQSTGTLIESTVTSVSINNSGLFLCSIGYTYSPYNQISNVWYSNDVTTNPSNPTWYLQITSSYGPALVDITASFAVISANSTNPATPQFMIATNKNGVWIYNSVNPTWTNTKLGNFNFTTYALCRINSSGSVAVVCSSNNNVGTINPSTSIFWISNNATTASPTWTQINTFPQVINSFVPFCFDINSLGNTIVCLPYNNTAIYGAIEILASYDNGNTWNIIYVSTSIAGLLLTSIFFYSSFELTSTGPFVNNPPSGTAPIVIGGFQNLQTKFITNSGQDLGNIFVQQPTNPGTSYIETKFQVNNYTPIWTNVSGTYDLGQIFLLKTPYTATGTYTQNISLDYYSVIFTTAGTITFLNPVQNLQVIIVGGGGAGGQNLNTINFTIKGCASGGGGGGGQAVIPFTNVVLTNLTFNVTQIGNGGTAIYNSAGNPGTSTILTDPNNQQYTVTGGAGGNNTQNSIAQAGNYTGSTTTSYGVSFTTKGSGGDGGYATGNQNTNPLPTPGGDSYLKTSNNPLIQTIQFGGGGGGSGFTGGEGGGSLGSGTGGYPSNSPNLNTQNANGYGGGGGAGGAYVSGNGYQGVCIFYFQFP